MLNIPTRFYRIIQPDRNISDPAEIPLYAFSPRPQDNGRLSVYDSSRISPRECLSLYNQRPNRPQAQAVAVVTQADLDQLKLPLRRQSGGHPAHCLIDLSELTPEQQHTKGTALRRIAQQRGVILVD